MSVKRMKKILAWIGLIVLGLIYLVTFILGIFGSPATADLFKACMILTIVVPVLFWAMIRVAKFLENSDD